MKFYEILSTNSFWKCTDITLERLYVNCEQVHWWEFGENYFRGLDVSYAYKICSFFNSFSLTRSGIVSINLSLFHTI